MLASGSLLRTSKTVCVVRAALLACFTMVWANSCDTAFGLNVKRYEHRSDDLDGSWKKTASFTYMEEENNYWKSPKEFERDGGGDCEDFCFYLMYHLGNGSRIYFVRLTGQPKNHAIVYYDGKFIEPQVYGRTYDQSQFKMLYWLSYADAMLLATAYGFKNQLNVTALTPSAREPAIP